MTSPASAATRVYPRAAVAKSAGVDASYLRRIELGTAGGSIATYARVAAALGGDLSLRLYPNTGPALRDRHQAGIGETLLHVAHPRWRRFAEVAVRRPSRGWIDACLHDPRASVLVAVEIQSELRRLEQLIRWSSEKAASLPSWAGWPNLDPVPLTSQLLIIRDTRTTREVVRSFRRILRTAFPGDPDDAIESLVGTGAWPGSSILWSSQDRTGNGWRIYPRR